MQDLSRASLGFKAAIKKRHKYIIRACEPTNIGRGHLLAGDLLHQWTGDVVSGPKAITIVSVREKVTLMLWEVGARFVLLPPPNRQQQNQGDTTIMSTALITVTTLSTVQVIPAQPQSNVLVLSTPP